MNVAITEGKAASPPPSQTDPTERGTAVLPSSARPSPYAKGALFATIRRSGGGVEGRQGWRRQAKHGRRRERRGKKRALRLAQSSAAKMARSLLGRTDAGRGFLSRAAKSESNIALSARAVPTATARAKQPKQGIVSATSSSRREVGIDLLGNRVQGGEGGSARRGRTRRGRARHDCGPPQGRAREGEARARRPCLHLTSFRPRARPSASACPPARPIHATYFTILIRLPVALRR